MAPRALQTDELLLALLRVLERRSMSDTEVLAELEAALGSEYRVVRRRVVYRLAVPRPCAFTRLSRSLVQPQ